MVRFLVDGADFVSSQRSLFGERHSQVVPWIGILWCATESMVFPSCCFEKAVRNWTRLLNIPLTF